ncbi:MAG: serine/threonine protein kinase [Planctomycetia bacterium]|nr:serine/threonine protein kinase [Planctomycetia bacterium]
MVPEPGLEPVPGFTLTGRLGQGAFGDVWEAVGLGNRCVALKFLDCRKRPASMVSAEIRLLRELSSLKHPNIITLHGVHCWGQYVVLNMERADTNLNDLLHTHREQHGTNLPVDQVLDYMTQAAAALDFIAGWRHSSLTGSQGMQHCDVKPTNLLLVGPVLKLADFGLCAGTGWQTHRGGCRGTPPYAAPELYRGTASPTTDQFSLAVTFCELVFGDSVFVRRSPADTPALGMPVELSKLGEKEYPILSRAMHPFPSSRYSSCKLFIDELRRAMATPLPAPRFIPRSLGSVSRPIVNPHGSTKTK